SHGDGNHPKAATPRPVRHREVASHLQRPAQVTQRAVRKDHVLPKPEPPVGEEVQPGNPRRVESDAGRIVDTGETEQPDHQEGAERGQPSNRAWFWKPRFARAGGWSVKRRHGLLALSIASGS